MGLLAVPLLIQVGLSPPSAISVLLMGICIQTALGTWQTRKAIPVRDTVWAFIVRAVFIVVGTTVLQFVVTGSVGLFKLMVGVVLCIIVPVQWLWRFEPKDHLHAAWGWLAFTLSGIMAGIFGMGGPPLVLWVVSQTWPAERIRGFLFCTFFLLCPFQLAALCVAFGPPAIEGIKLGALMIPAVILGSLLGLPIGKRLDPARVRLIAYVLLLVIGGQMIFSYFAQRGL